MKKINKGKKMKNKKNITTERKTIDMQGILQRVSLIANNNNRLLERMNKGMRNANSMLEEIGNTLDKLGNNISTDFKSLAANIVMSVFTDNEKNASHIQEKHRLSKANSQYIAYLAQKSSRDIPLPSRELVEIYIDEFKKGLRGKKLKNISTRVAEIVIALIIRRKEAEYIEEHSNMSDLDIATFLGQQLNFNVAILLEDAIDTKLNNKETLKNTSLKDILLREAYDKKNGIFHKGAKHKASYFSEKDTTGIPHGKPSYSRYLKQYNGNNRRAFLNEYGRESFDHYFWQGVLNPLKYYASEVERSAKRHINNGNKLLEGRLPGYILPSAAPTNYSNPKPKKSIYPSSLTEDLSLPNNNITLVGDIIASKINKMETMMSSLPKISSYLGGYNLPALNAPNNSNNSNIINNNNIEININATGDVNTDALRNTVGTAVIDSIQQGTSFID